MKDRLLNEEDVKKAVVKAVNEWNALTFCPFCFSRNIKKKMFRKDHVCEDCGRTIEYVDY